MGHKKIGSFNDVERYLDYRIKMVGGAGFDDSWVTDKQHNKKTIDGFFDCKWCSGKMDAAEYRNGSLYVSCHTDLCPGNLDSGMANKIHKHKFDTRELTNQYLFNSRLQF